MDCGCNSFEKYASSNLYSFLLFRSVARWRSMAAEKAVTNFKVHFQHLLAVMKMIATVSRHNSFTNGSQVKLIWMCSIQSYPSSCKHRASIDWSHRSKPLPRSKKKSNDRCHGIIWQIFATNSNSKHWIENIFFFQIQEFDLILIAVDRMLPLRFNTIK